MKRLIISILLLVMTTAPFSQQADPIIADYLKKSRNQKTAAWIMLSSGTIAAFIGVSFAIVENDIGDDSPTPFIVLASAGGAAMAGSIFLFAASSKNKKKAMSLSFRNIPAKQMIGNSIAYRSIPSLSLKINL
ncbi:MAG TPA: hypothetical protein VIU35_10240 [Chitinophagaceae bacterium]